MFKTPSKNEINQEEVSQNTPTFFREYQEKSDEDSENTNIDSDQSFNEFSIIQRISSAIDDITVQNEAKNTNNNSIHYDDSVFAHKEVPKISIEDYLNRIRKYSKLEDSTLIIALIYIDRLLKNQKIVLSIFNVHRILLTAILLAIKYNEDEIYDNSFFARIFGITTKELNKLENKFLDLIEFKLFITKKTFQLYYDKI